MKKSVVSFFLVALGLAAGFTMPRILAQSESPGTVRKWEQFCEPHQSNRERIAKHVSDWNNAMKARGAEGYQLVQIVSSNSDLSFALCYRRPAR